MRNTITIHDLECEACEELDDYIKNNAWNKDETRSFLDEPHDTIHEIADSSVPIHTSDLMELAARDNNLALNEPELGPAFDGSATPVNIIAANVFEAIEAALWDHVRDLQQDTEEA